MIGQALDMIAFVIEGSTYIIEITLEFIPEPFNYMLLVSMVMLFVLIGLKLIRLAGDLISGLVGIFT